MRTIMTGVMMLCLAPNVAGGADHVREAQIHRWIADLADDDTKFNAHRAIRRLRHAGDAALPALERALDSPDWQQRQCAAEALRALDGYNPSPRMLEVNVEGLRHDSLPEAQGTNRRPAYNDVYNADDGTRYLLRHAEAAEGALVHALASDDRQQRFLAAFVLGSAGRTAAVKQAAPILIPHLRDNDIPGDALMAASALYRFGPDVMGFLADALPFADHQQYQCIRLIMLDITDPPETTGAVYDRREMHDITRRFHDPVLEFRFDGDGIRWRDQMSRDDQK